MKIENLRLFLEVAESGSINKTAEQNFLTHQSLGVILKSLEKELNCTLFIRTNKGVALSAEGKEFLPYARQAVGAIDEYMTLHPTAITDILQLYTTPVLAGYIRNLQKDPIAGKYYLSINEHNIEELSTLMHQPDDDTQKVYFFPLLRHEKNENPATPLSKIVITSDETIIDICHEKNPLMNKPDNLKELLDKAIADDPPVLLKEGGLIKKGYNQEVDECREASVNGKTWLTDLEAKEREETGIKNLKISFNKVFGYYIEVTKSYLHLVPPHYVRKQTLVNNERYITDELKKMEDTILGAEERLTRLEFEVFCQVREYVLAQADRLRRTASAIARLDALASYAETADRENYCRPDVLAGDVTEISIKDGRHPVVEKMNASGDFVPNDVLLDCNDNLLLVITGPNMAGKSTYMRQVALMILMVFVLFNDIMRIVG